MRTSRKNSVSKPALGFVLVLILCVPLLTLFSACEPANILLGQIESPNALGGAGGEESTSCSVLGASCEVPLNCCSEVCESGTCTRPPTDGCQVSDSPCNENIECCSGLCSEGSCSPDGSYCSQEGDLCEQGVDCCSGTCLISDELEEVGLCDAVPSGPSNCSGGIAGSLCDDCNDCCSRVCTNYGEGETKICLQAQGCRQTGELCQNDQECCGGEVDSGLPGAGNVRCELKDDADWGICRNALACSPQGNVCHIKDYVCSSSSASNRCCAADGAEGNCILDAAGVPRCDGLSGECRNEGASCAMNEDCCDSTCEWVEGEGFRCSSNSSP